MPHLYIHVPFCRRRCSYCDFAIAVRRTVPVEDFVAAVLAERGLRAPREGWEDAVFDTVYLGGGTPSLLGDGIAPLLAAFPRSPGAEVTLEANPDDVTPAAVTAWREAGVTRVSLGVQSFDDRVLRWMHRTHDGASARRAFAHLRDGGIPSVSADLIFALPDELDHDPRSDLETLLELGPGHVSAYGLTLEPRTPWARWVGRGGSAVPADERYAAEFLAIHDLLTLAGFEHYEVSNYARPGARARHNGIYWQGADYVGLGPSAHGLRDGERRWNVAQWSAYRRAVGDGRDPVEGRETLTRAQRDLELVLLGLRTSEGITLTDAERNLNTRARLAAEQAGWLTARQGRLTASLRGWLVLDTLLPALTTFSEGG